MSTSSMKSDLMKLIVKSSPMPELVDKTMIVALEETVRPIARNLFQGIGELEGEIQRSKNLANEIGNRSWYSPKNFFSGKKDLAAVANTQNSINRRLFDLIQEIIRVNMLSHASLIALMVEMKKGMKNGFTDANGHITRLGTEGQNLAETATQVISGILDASKDTQERINQNSKGIKQISQELEVKAKLDSSQDEAIALLEQQAEAKDELDSRQSEAIANLEKIAKAKDELDSQQSEAIANLEKIAKAKDELDSKQQVAIDEQKESFEKLTVQFALLSKGLKDAQTALQQHQGDTSNQITKLGNSLQNWRWITAVLVLVPIAWLAIITFR